MYHSNVYEMTYFVLSGT